MAHTLNELVLNSTGSALLTQYVFLCVIAFLHINHSLKKRWETVVVLNHLRVIFETLGMSLLNLAFYHAVLWFNPNKFLAREPDLDKEILKIIAILIFVLVALRIWDAVTNGLLLDIDKGKSVKDMKKQSWEPFSCDGWPLIRRCANRSLRLLVVIGILLLRLTH